MRVEEIGLGEVWSLGSVGVEWVTASGKQGESQK